MQIYVTSIIRSNQIGLLLALKNMEAFKIVSQGTLEWRMHETCKMASIL
jgi:hypothetical protein